MMPSIGISLKKNIKNEMTPDSDSVTNLWNSVDFFSNDGAFWIGNRQNMEYSPFLVQS